MAEQENGGFLHSLYENMYYTIVAGLVIPIVSFTVWGLIEIITEPQMDVDKYMQTFQSAPAQVETQPAAPAPEAAPAEEAK